MIFTDKNGFTLIEISVVALLISLLAAIAFKFTSNANTVAMPNLTNRLILQMEGRRIADNLLEEIRKSGEVVRPTIGETTPFLLLRDAENQVRYFYLDYDVENSKKYERKLFEICDFTKGYDANKSRFRKIGGSLESLTFTCVSPNCVQINIRVANDKSRFQFISQAGLMSLGDSDV